MGNPLKRGADPYADADAVQNLDQVSCGQKNVVVSGANTGIFVAPIDGRLSRISLVTTVAVTVAVAEISITVGGDALTFVFDVKIQSIGDVQIFDVPEEVEAACARGDKIVITSNAGATAGACDFNAYVQPFE